MKILEEMPKSGQFIQIHMHNGAIWSTTYRYIDDRLNRYSISEDNFIEDNLDLNPKTNYKYIVEID